jgi:hypothetical protein
MREPGWPCSGPLLRLAQRFADKLLPAFNTDTGMPYGKAQGYRTNSIVSVQER